MNDIQTILLKLIILHGLTDQEEWFTFLALRQLSKYAYEYTKQFYRSTMKSLSKLIHEEKENRVNRVDDNSIISIDHYDYYLLGNLKHGKAINRKIYENYPNTNNYYNYYKNKKQGKHICHDSDSDTYRISYYNNDKIWRYYHFSSSRLHCVEFNNLNFKIRYDSLKICISDISKLNRRMFEKYAIEGKIESYKYYTNHDQLNIKYCIDGDGNIYEINVYDERGYEIKRYHLYNSGIIESKGSIKTHAKIGLWKYYHKNGDLHYTMNHHER